MGRRAKYGATEARRALEETSGLVEPAADSLGVTVKTMYNYINRYGLWTHVKTERNELVAMAKVGLKKHLQQDEPPQWAITFTLTTLASEEFEDRQTVAVEFGDAKDALARIIARRADTG